MNHIVRTALAIVALFVFLLLGAYLDRDLSETDAAQATALNLNDAIRDARLATKE